MQFSGERPILATRHTDEPGVIAGITAILYAYRINIGNMQVNRTEDGKTACMYMELDGELPEEVLRDLCGRSYALAVEKLPKYVRRELAEQPAES